MKKMKHIEKNAERIAKGIAYYFTLIAIFLIMFFAACHILNGIIDPCITMLESLAENALRMTMAMIKILLVIFFLIAIYKVFLESEKKHE